MRGLYHPVELHPDLTRFRADDQYEVVRVAGDYCWLRDLTVPLALLLPEGV